MSLWIRIQNKEMLINCHAIEIDLGDGKCICSNGYVLGTYSTKETALEVLDIIEDCIVGNINCVFQMPQDEELDK